MSTQKMSVLLESMKQIDEGSYPGVVDSIRPQKGHTDYNPNEAMFVEEDWDSANEISDWVDNTLAHIGVMLDRHEAFDIATALKAGNLAAAVGMAMQRSVSDDDMEEMQYKVHRELNYILSLREGGIVSGDEEEDDHADHTYNEFDPEDWEEGDPLDEDESEIDLSMPDISKFNRDFGFNDDEVDDDELHQQVQGIRDPNDDPWGIGEGEEDASVPDDIQLNEFGYVEREYTGKVIDAMDEGMMDPRGVADAALKYLSEDQVKDMVRANDWSFLFTDEEDEDGHDETFGDADGYQQTFGNNR